MRHRIGGRRLERPPYEQNGNLLKRLKPIVPDGQITESCPAPFAKKFRFALTPNQHYIPRRLVPQRGARAIVTDAGRDAVDIDGAEDDRRLRWTAKSCGPDAPTLESSRWRQLRRRRWQKSPVTGESTKETVKTIAQGRPGVSGKPVVTTLVCFTNFAREAAGASGTRLSLRPLLSEGQKFGQTSDAWRRENAKVCLRTMSSSPRKRGSSIPETLMMESRGCGVLDRPVKPDDDRFDCLKLNRKLATCPEVVRHYGISTCGAGGIAKD
jgi:hypothetical protein